MVTETNTDSRSRQDRLWDAEAALAAARSAMVQAARDVDGIASGPHRTIMVAITATDDAVSGIRRVSA